MGRKKVKRPANWWQKTGEKEWTPTEVERPWYEVANSMNVRIMVFQQVFRQRPDCGPEGREIRVRETS